MTIHARALSLGLVLAGFAVVSAQARTRPDTVPVFDRHAVHSIGSEAVIGERSLRKVRTAAKQIRRKKQRRATVKPAAKAGTLSAYRKHIETAAMDAGPVAKGLGNIQGLQQGFITKLAALKGAMPSGLGFNVGSGYRSYAEQARLHALKPRLAARPGRSQHEKGLAGDLKFASRESARWVHRHSSRYGLRFPMRHEPWHIEPVGVTRYAAKHRRYALAR